MGETIPHVAAVSGHCDWKSLQRYTQLQQKGDKWAAWRGLDLIAPISGGLGQLATQGKFLTKRLRDCARSAYSLGLQAAKQVARVSAKRPHLGYSRLRFCPECVCLNVH